jgi:hypothetical protein
MTSGEPILLLMALIDQRRGTLEELSKRFDALTELLSFVQAVEHPAVAERHGDDVKVAIVPPRVDRIIMQARS